MKVDVGTLIAVGVLDEIEAVYRVLFQDDFTTTEANPLTTPRTAEPGPGTLNITDSGANLSIVDAALHTANGSGAFFTTDYVWTDEIDFRAGFTAFIDFTNAVASNGVRLAIANAADAPADPRTGISLGDASLDRAEMHFETPTSPTNSYTRLTGLDEAGSAKSRFWITLPTVGRALFFYEDSSDNVYFLGALVQDDDLLTSLKAGVGIDDLGDLDITRFAVGVPTAAALKQAQGLATTTSESPADEETFTHSSDGFLEFVVDTLPTSTDVIRIEFRIQDASNKYVLEIDAAGDFDLIEVVAGVETSVASKAAQVTAGNQVVLAWFEDHITASSGFGANRQMEFNSATYTTETEGKIVLEGAAVISDFAEYNRVVSAAVKASLQEMAS